MISDIEHALLVRDIAAIANSYKQSASTAMRFINLIANHKNPFDLDPSWMSIGKGSDIVVRLRKKYPELWARIEEYLVSEDFK
jgi:hypothetical protein